MEELQKSLWVPLPTGPCVEVIRVPKKTGKPPKPENSHGKVMEHEKLAKRHGIL